MGRGSGCGLARAGGLGWAGFFLRTKAGRLAAGYFPKFRATAPLPPWSSGLAPGGLSRGPGPCDRALTWGARAGGRREPGPGLRGGARPLLPGLRAQPALRLQQRVDTEGQRAGPRAVPATCPEPRGVHDERRRGHARAGRRGACGARRARCGESASCGCLGLGGAPALRAL